MKAGEVYVDPSGLTRLYIHQPGSREISLWRHRISGSLAVTHHGRLEMTNAIYQAVFLGHLSDAAGNQAAANLALDFAEGRLHQAEILWRAALNRAADLAQKHTPKLGVRTLDVLHVGCALELRMPYFLTFDDRQRKLAASAGLKTINLAS